MSDIFSQKTMQQERKRIILGPISPAAAGRLPADVDRLEREVSAGG